MGTYYCITVNIPEKDADNLRKAMGKAGAGRIGNYSYGSFSTKGIGRGVALDGASPSVGEIGELEETSEERIETFCQKEDLQRILATIKSIHPYEEPVITFYPIEIV